MKIISSLIVVSLLLICIFSHNSFSCPSDVLEQPVVRLVSKEREIQLRKLLPKTNDKTLQELLDKPLIFYTDEEMPRAYQHDGGFHDVFYNISATQPVEPFGNPNREFPWGHPAGTHDCNQKNLFIFRFAYFPDKISWKYGAMPKTDNVIMPTYNALQWYYPKDTVFAEVLCLKDGDDWKPFELRTRHKPSGKAKMWRINVYRPIVNKTEFEIAVGKEVQTTTSVGKLANRHPFSVLDRTAGIDELPKLPDTTVRKLLSRPFHSALGESWSVVSVQDKEHQCYAPTTKEDFHIVPRNYKAGFLEVSSKSCMSCHEGTLINSFTFEGGRDWYGRLRGSDGIISFHIADPSCISHNGMTRRYQLRKELRKILKEE